MRYFKDKTYVDADGSTRFYEFQKGMLDYEAGAVFWREDSIYIEDDTVWELQLDRLFSEVLNDYDCTGDTPVNRQQWERIAALAAQTGGKWKEAIEELKPWAEETFLSYDLFTIIGM